MLNELRPLLERLPQRYFNATEAAHYLGIPRKRVYNLARARRVPAIREGSRLLFDRLALDAWMAALADNADSVQFTPGDQMTRELESLLVRKLASMPLP